MKTTKFKEQLCAAILLCMLTMSHQSIGQIDCAVALDKEYKLKLDVHLIDPPEARRHRANFEARFRYRQGNQDVAYKVSPEVIPMHKLISKFYCKSWESACKNDSCVTALKITLGQKNDEVVYFYQPVYLKFKNTSGRERTFKIFNDNETTYYRYVNGEFEIATDLSAIDFYRENVRIKHTKGANAFERLHDEGDLSWKSDSKSVLFTFQEIFLLYDKAFKDDPDWKLYKEYVTINTAAANFKKSWATLTWRMKHTLYLGTRKGDKFLDARVDESGANFAHLCPPSCNEPTFSDQ